MLIDTSGREFVESARGEMVLTQDTDDGDIRWRRVRLAEDYARDLHDARMGAIDDHQATVTASDDTAPVEVDTVCRVNRLAQEWDQMHGTDRVAHAATMPDPPHTAKMHGANQNVRFQG